MTTAIEGNSAAARATLNPSAESTAEHELKSELKSPMPTTIDAVSSSASEISDYNFSLVPHTERVTGSVDGTVIVDSTNAIVLRETRLAPVFYFPQQDVQMDLMQRASLRTYCPFKGNATYWDLQLQNKTIEKAMWSYETPLPEAASIAGYVAFFPELFDQWVDGSQPLGVEQDPCSTAPVPADNDDFEATALQYWLLHDAPLCENATVLTRSFIDALRQCGIPINRFIVVIPTLHPQLLAVSYRWWLRSDQLEEVQIPYEVISEPEFLNSPLAGIFDGAGGIRRRLEDAQVELDFPILEELRNEGATDYVAMPMTFSDGQINAITLATHQRGGFTTAHLGQIYEILSVLARLYEVHSLRYRASTLLETYLGKHAGSRVLDGLIKRRDGEDIDAIIWFCDLRDSTRLAYSMPRENFLGLLDRFFDCMAGTVLEHGGQVLRFIGDAALAIFPIGDTCSGGMSAGDARQAALNAARAAAHRLDAMNIKRRAKGREPLRYGIGLHQGRVTYGNIGTKDRLEFTVIGDAANRAARIESMSKELGHPIVVSASICVDDPSQFVPLGEHGLRGLEGKEQLFALRTDSTASSDELSDPTVRSHV